MAGIEDLDTFKLEIISKSEQIATESEVAANRMRAIRVLQGYGEMALPSLKRVIEIGRSEDEILQAMEAVTAVLQVMEADSIGG